jgi:hypothetical protein
MDMAGLWVNGRDDPILVHPLAKAVGPTHLVNELDVLGGDDPEKTEGIELLVIKGTLDNLPSSSDTYPSSSAPLMSALASRTRIERVSLTWSWLE